MTTVPAVITLVSTEAPPTPAVAVAEAPAGAAGAALAQAAEEWMGGKDADLHVVQEAVMVGSGLEEYCQERAPPCGHFLVVSEDLT